MDQVFQLQQQIQRLQQEVNSISQVCNQISSIAQQMVSQAAPFQRSFQGAGVIPGTYTTTYTGPAGQTGVFAPQAGLGANITQPGTGILGGAQYGTFGQGITPQFGWGQNLANLSAVPSWTQGTYTSQLQPFAQGYSPNQFSTGGQLGYASQAFASPLTAQFGTGMQSANLGISGLGSGMQSANLGASGLGSGMQSANLGMQGTGTGQGAFQGTGMGTSFSQAGLGQAGMSMAGYSPYQSNMYGFR